MLTITRLPPFYAQGNYIYSGLGDVEVSAGPFKAKFTGESERPARNFVLAALGVAALGFVGYKSYRASKRR